MSVLAENKKAYFNYEILATYEAGIELQGFEVKAVKAGQANLTGAFALIRGGEAWLTNADIPAYQPKNAPASYEPTRTRRLLLTKKEIKEIVGKMQAKKLNLVPLKLFTKNNLVKVALGLARSKKKFDKRETIKKREVQRTIRREAV